MSTNNIHPTAIIAEEAKLGENITVGPYSIIGPEVVIGNGTTVESHVVIEGETIIGENNYIFSFASIGKVPQDLKFKGEKTRTVIGNNNKIREFVTIHRGTDDKYETRIGNNCLIMAYVHIAHDCVIGSGDIIGNATKFAGEVTVDDNAIISANILCHQFCHIGGYVMIQGGSRFSMDIPPYIIVGKEPARYMGINLIGLRRRGFSNELIELIHNAYRILYGTGTRAENIQKIKNELQITPEIQKIIDFVESSERGIIK